MIRLLLTHSRQEQHMYLDYFSLKRHPFRITPDPSLFFHGGAHGRGVVLDALVYGITTGEGILKVVGEVGSGKTMLCRMLEERLPPTVEIVYLANPNLSARDIVYAVAFGLKLPVDASTDRLVVMHKLQDYLLTRHAAGANVVVFIEEAQSMPLETLEEVRLLSNLETHRHKLMQIVLFGQPELDRKLENKSIRQLRERITHSFQLLPLNEQEIREYLHFRLQAAGCPWPQLFSTKAEQMLAKASAGLSRRINILADKALLAAYADPSSRPERRNSAGEVLPMVLPRHVKIAIKDSGYSNENAQLKNWLVYGASAAALLVAGIGVGLWLSPGSSEGRSTVAAQVAAPVIQQPVAQTTSEPVQPIASAQTVTAPAPSTAGLVNASTTSSATIAGKMSEKPDVPSSLSTSPPVTASAPTDSVVSGVGDGNVDVEAELPSAPAAAVTSYSPSVAASIPEGLTGLVAVRAHASVPWLAQLGQRSGYSIQMYAVGLHEADKLQEYFEFLEMNGMLEEVYLCRISASGNLQAQWLVLRDAFAGYSDAENYIRQLPPYLSQYGPYVRNVNGIACTN
ncbi:MAG: AAA family ATPase [Pseudomonadota bacterium]